MSVAYTSVRGSSPASFSRIASEYASSPVLQPATHTFTDGHVASIGSTSARIARKYAGSRNISVTCTVRKSSSSENSAGSRSTLPCSSDTVSTRRRAIAPAMRRLSDTNA